MSRDVTVEEVMTRGVWQISPSRAVTEAAGIMADEEVGFLPVTGSEGGVVGVLTMRDLVVRVVSARLPLSTRVADVMTEAVVCCRASDELSICEHLMLAHQVTRLVVVDDTGRLAGVVTQWDLARYEDERRLRQVLADLSARTTLVH
jgi:CBS-domain-containing membrane protein